jgi:hypothetical protein
VLLECSRDFLLLTDSDSRCTLQDMKHTAIEVRIASIKGELNKLGPIHPGSLSQQFNVCGKPRCRCKDPKKPRRHGPYYQLSFTWRGKSSTRFLRPEQVEEMRQKVANYKRLRELMNEWVSLAVEREGAERAQEKHHRGD